MALMRYKHDLESHSAEVAAELGTTAEIVTRVTRNYWLTIFDELKSFNVDKLTLEEADAWDPPFIRVVFLGRFSYPRRAVRGLTRAILEGRFRGARAGRVQRQLYLKNKGVIPSPGEG